MEHSLQPLDLKTKYSKTEIEAKALELKVSDKITTLNYHTPEELIFENKI